MKMTFSILRNLLSHPDQIRRLLRMWPKMFRGFGIGQKWEPSTKAQVASVRAVTEAAAEGLNPLKSYFDSHREGRGIWKWTHYFDIYHRHFSKFVGREVHVLEIGIYSGGSLKMWRDYFGPECHVYGVDIEEACKVYEDDHTKVFVGDQADREFWRRLKQQVPAVDILIDDGGHSPTEQIVTLEEMLPHLRAGGVYLCEDVHGALNRFAAYAHGFAHNLNAYVAAPTKSGRDAVLE
jgi:hypothetical protein